MSTIGYYICVPFAWLVRLFYNLTNSYGVALILFTLVIKLIMLPFQMKSKKSMMRMSRVSGQMQELQKRYAKNQAKLQEEMQKLYEEEGVNPMSGCLWSLIPFPILIALYSIIRQPITHFMMLSKDVLQTVVQSAADAGVNLTNIVMMDKATGAPALKDRHALGVCQELHLHLGRDRRDPDPHSGRPFPVCVQQAHHEDPASGGRCRRCIHEVHDVYDASVQRLHRLRHACRTGRVLDCPEEARFQARQADRQRRMEEARVQEQQRKQEEQKKKTLREKQQAAQAAKAAKAAKAATSTTEAGRVGDRPYARGRAYKADRYDET